MAGSVATYFCDDGSELAGNSTRICEEDRTWSGEAPTCTRKEIAANYHCKFLEEVITLNCQVLD